MEKKVLILSITTILLFIGLIAVVSFWLSAENDLTSVTNTCDQFQTEALSQFDSLKSNYEDLYTLCTGLPATNITGTTSSLSGLTSLTSLESSGSGGTQESSGMGETVSVAIVRGS